MISNQAPEPDTGPAHRRSRRAAISAAALLALVSLLAIACSSAATETTETSSGPNEGSASAPADELTGTLQEFVGDLPGGVTVAVRHDGETTFTSFGQANNSGEALAPATPLRVGSISKPFVAVMMLQLVDEGSVELDAPVSTYLTDPIVGGDVTIRQLLSHRSGLVNYTEQSGLMIRTLANLDEEISLETVLEAVADETHDPPGSFFSYSNTNYILAGQVIEAVDGGDLEGSLQRRIAEPLDLATTSFDFGTPGDEVAAGWSPPFFDGTPGDDYVSIASGAWAAGALVSSVEDLMVFLDALRDGELLSPDSLAQMTDVDSGYGLGIATMRLGSSGAGIGHNGAIPGYRSIMSISLDGEAAVIVLSNNDELNAEALGRQILQSW